jgi:hypothetical protein
MSYLNANIPTITCYIRNEFLFNNEKGHTHDEYRAIRNINAGEEILCIYYETEKSF